MTRRWLVAGLGLMLLGCPRSPKHVVYDLADRMFVADRWASRDVLLFGTPATEPFQADGFYREAGVPAGDRFVWSKAEAELSLDWPAAAPRLAILDAAPYRGVRDQAAEVRLNGTRVGRFRLNDDRHRYRIELPAAVQKPGENRLRFVFAAAAAPAAQDGGRDTRQLAAAFYSLVVGAAGDEALEDFLRRDAPAPFSIAHEGGIPVLTQTGPSSVQYALRLPPGAELRFTPALHPAARTAAASAVLRVTLEADAGVKRELWSRVLDARDTAPPSEVTLSLAGEAGRIVRLGLEVGAAAAGRFAWGVWRAPRVLGRGAEDAAGDPLAPAPIAPDVERRADALREGLRGANVMLVILDAARARQLGCYGYARATTPHVDAIAKDGVVFERAYTPAVYTLGAMSSLWTSQYPDRHHAEVSYADRLPADRLTLAESVGARGVHTAGFVANAMAGTAFGFERGFGEFHEVFRRFPDLGSRAEAMLRVLPEWLRANAGRRFFAYVHFREPHFPYDPGPPFESRFGPDAPLSREQRRDKAWYTGVNQGRVAAAPEEIAHLVRLYDANLALVDEQVGALRRALEASGAWDRTVLILAADHGEQLHEHGYISHSAQVYEESVHVPLIVRFPAGAGPRGVRLRALVDLLDVAPTVLDILAKGEQEAPAEFQGRSLLPVVAGGAGKPALLSRTVWERPVYALRDEQFKLIHDTRSGRELLFDVENDPREQGDLAPRAPLQAAYYRQALHHWIQGLPEVRRARGGPGPAAKPTAEQCENFRSLGYVVAGCE